ncbi:hypothetical protein GCM10011344_47620 [Dokdonia pacifica]|uniref:Immunity MXAN-0049 protein domain-containing protein n=1 Tax=Dokdonia pacifica TaxID=1627892 RepID=A0A239DWP8_9FLAO|nr:DUF1629 domain-containing protein [Dokdonia pacifica]GGG41206.1 hypothetical protein GCM10011344_47620 [Dokdonia pacifica]SNS36044.1 hypothetical protein SAMN06265376_11266 [Dokdonia pacifica]
MKIFRFDYTIDEDKNYTYIDPKIEFLSLEEEMLLRNGEKLTLNEKRKIPVKNKKKKIPDILKSGEVLVNEKVKKLLEEQTTAIINYIPLKVDKYDYWLLNIINHLDCFDYENSEFTTLKSGKPFKITNLKLITQNIPEIAIFRLKEKSSTLFVTDKLKTILEEANVTGIRFNEDMNLTIGF